MGLFTIGIRIDGCIIEQRTVKVGHHANGELGRGAVGQLRQFEISHARLPKPARRQYPCGR